MPATAASRPTVVLTLAEAKAAPLRSVGVEAGVVEVPVLLPEGVVAELGAPVPVLGLDSVWPNVLEEPVETDNGAVELAELLPATPVPVAEPLLVLLATAVAVEAPIENEGDSE
jgi:hypothetical protein